MAFCLRADGSRPLFGWFDLADNEKIVLLTMLKKLLGADRVRHEWAKENVGNIP